MTATETIYSFPVTTLDGGTTTLQEYAGRVLLVVNVASQCGYTPQYAGLQKLYEEFAERGLVVLGFPCNEFGGQEPGTPEQIRQFCTATYHVTFPLFEKVHVLPGDDQSPLYRYLGKQLDGELPNWNFCKYLVGRDGRVWRFYASKVTPNSSALRQDIEDALAESAGGTGT